MNIQANPNYIASDADIIAIRDAIAADKGWFKIVDPLHPKNGTIFKLTLPSSILSPTSAGIHSFMSPTHMFKTSYQRFCSKGQLINMGGQKPNSVKLSNFLFELLDDYSGPVVGANNCRKADPGFVDLMGTPIKLNSFVAASNGQGMVLGNVTEFVAERQEHQIKFKARVKVLIDDSASSALVHPYHMSQTATHTIGVNIKNLIVITDDIKTQSMLKKLGLN